MLSNATEKQKPVKTPIKRTQTGLNKSTKLTMIRLNKRGDYVKAKSNGLPIKHLVNNLLTVKQISFNKQSLCVAAQVNVSGKLLKLYEVVQEINNKT